MPLLSQRSAAMLTSAAKHFRRATRGHFRRLGSWRRLSNNDIWMRTVYQVAVVGSASSMSRLRASPSAQEALAFGYLRRLNPTDQAQAVHHALRAHGVRYVPAKMCECRKTRAVLANFEFLVSVPGGPRGYLQRLSLERDEHERAVQIARDLRYIKLKGSRDLMADLGLARNVIALDVRLLNLLKLVGVRVPSKVRTTRQHTNKSRTRYCVRLPNQRA
jgi:hypothetical protein